MLPAAGTRVTRRIPASIRPAGYRGAAGPHAKGHLLADTLGGPHDNPANFVTLFHGAGPRINNGAMATFEMQVRRVVSGTEPGVAAQNVIYRSVARGRGELPDSMDLLAIGERGWWRQIRLPNR
jgi:filamentous hemagglutinin